MRDRVATRVWKLRQWRLRASAARHLALNCRSVPHTLVRRSEMRLPRGLPLPHLVRPAGPYSSSVPQVSASGGGSAVREPGAVDACGGDLPRGIFLRCDSRGRIRGVDASRHAAPRDEWLARSVGRFSPDFRARRCAWTTDECSDDGDHASTIRVSLGPSQRVQEGCSDKWVSRRPCHA
jgi:hypothetical protein